MNHTSSLCRLLSLLIVLAATACNGPAGGGGPAQPDAGAPDAGDPPDPAFDIDLFGRVGHDFRFIVAPEQALKMEQGGFGGGDEDQYELGGGTYADDLVVTDVEDGETHDFGKVELKLIGESTFRTWDRIPNLRVDMDQFQDDLGIDGVEHFRLNNGQVGGIYREAIALRVWGALGYPVPRTTFAWAQAPNQWGEDVRVPYTFVEVYKPDWCERAMPGCLNIWEAAGEVEGLLGNCQFDECEESRLLQLVGLLQITEPGPGYVAATEDYIDWDAWRSFQCLSWITGTGDDYIHNTNNLVLVERPDGKFQTLPYSVDISANQDWYQDVRLLGHSQLARGCQNDPACWQPMLDRCDELLDQIEDDDVFTPIVEKAIAEVRDAGMTRDGDDARATFVRQWYASRAAAVRADPVWDQTPCVDDATCEDRDDGKTECLGVCIEPGTSCFDVGCPDGYWCDEFGECQNF